MKAIKELFMGKLNRNVYDFNPGVRTITPNENISYAEWCKEFKVSCLHGKVITYISGA